MSLKFRRVCEIFEQLACAKGEDTAVSLVQSWFREHDDAIPREGPQALALLSCLLLARRADIQQELEGGVQARLAERRQMGDKTTACSAEEASALLANPHVWFYHLHDGGLTQALMLDGLIESPPA